MSVQTLYKEFAGIATIDNVDDILVVHTEDVYAVGITVCKGQCKFINGRECSSKILHEMLNI